MVELFNPAPVALNISQIEIGRWVSVVILSR